MRLVQAVARRYLVISFFYLAGIIHLQAQQEYSKFDHLTINDGLSSNRIWCLYRDSRDYLWISTDVGLDKYDSYQVKGYRYDENQPGTISSNGIRCIYEDRGKNLWFGTINGLNLYDPSKDNFKVFKNNPADKNSIDDDYISGIIEDKNGALWILSNGNCLNKWIPGSQSFIRYKFDNNREDLIIRPARLMANDSKGNIWIISFDRGIYCFNPESGKFTKYDDPAINFGFKSYKSLYIDNQDKIWIGTDGGGFFSYDPVINKFKQFCSTGEGKGTNQNRILDIIAEDDRYILLAVDQGGVNRYDKISGTFEYIRHDERNKEGLSNNGIWCLHKDREGILWIGTSGGGVNYFNPKKENFKLFLGSYGNPKALSYDVVLCFYEDHEGKIWIGTDGGGINVYDPKTGSFTVYKNIPSDPYSISGNAVRCISEDKDHDLWITTWDAGLNRFDRKTSRFFCYLPEENNPLSISGETIWSFIIDHNGKLWLGVFQKGVDLFDKKKGVVKRFKSDRDDPDAISNNSSWFIYEDSEENIWICTSNGLNLFQSRTNSFKVFNFEDNGIQAFIRDIEGNLWVGSNSSGIYYCNPDGTIIKTFTVDDGLPSNSIRAIVEDNDFNLWISTTNGISRFDHNTKMFKNYIKEDGLQGNEFIAQSFLKTREGEIYFGGYNGFNSFYPDSLKDNDFIPPVYITDFQIFNKPAVYGSQEGQFPTYISEAKEITLTWRQSVFSFSFAAINYTFPGKNQYAYRMEGFEKEWNNTNASRRYVTYTNLDPGEYTFRVKASNNDGIWNEKGVSLRVIILPPWWQTWWFRLISISAIILAVVYIFLSRVRQLKNQKLLLEKTVAIKTAELSELNASKDKFFSIIAHDLKNPFNAIIGISELLKEEIESGDPAGIEEHAALINNSAVQTSRLLENLLEWANSQTGKILFNPAPIKLSELLNEELSILNDMAARKNIELKSSIADNLTIMADKNMIKTVLRNLISNAIKFTHNNGKVEVQAILDNNQVEVAVSDSGIGMTKETMAKLFRIDANLSTRGTENEKGTGLGLFLCKEFIQKHGGKIWVESEPGKGSIFKFMLPAGKNTSV
jgi:signal transduction histidine kinase/ligand-binding sensor domain-containing protein